MLKSLGLVTVNFDFFELKYPFVVGADQRVEDKRDIPEIGKASRGLVVTLPEAGDPNSVRVFAYAAPCYKVGEGGYPREKKGNLPSKRI